MKTTITNEQLLQISSIKDLTSIEYKDLYLPATNGKKQLIPGFIITYGPSNTILFLTELDPYFEEFVKKIKDVYLKEKDHVIRDGIRGKEYIEINDLTKQMLLYGSLDKTSLMYNHYATKESYNESLLMEEDRVKSLFPIIEYHIKEFLNRFNRTLTNIELSEGINGVYYIKGKIDNTYITIPIYIEMNDSSFKAIFASLLEDAIPIEMEGEMSRRGIRIHTYIEDYNYSDYTTYEVEDNKPVLEREIHYGGVLVHYGKKSLPPTTKETAKEIDSLDNDSSNVIWYELPWNSFLGLEEEKYYLTEEGERTEQEQKERIVDNKIIYISRTKENFYLREIRTKRYHKKIDDRIQGGNVVLDSMDKRKIGLIGDVSLVETYFLPNGVTGKYKDSLAGHYYYQIFPKELKKENETFLNREQGAIEKSDLFDVKKYIKKGDA